MDQGNEARSPKSSLFIGEEVSESESPADLKRHRVISRGRNPVVAESCAPWLVQLPCSAAVG
jgi:hypothetical protein